MNPVPIQAAPRELELSILLEQGYRIARLMTPSGPSAEWVVVQAADRVRVVRPLRRPGGEPEDGTNGRRIRFYCELACILLSGAWPALAAPYDGERTPQDAEIHDLALELRDLAPAERLSLVLHAVDSLTYDQLAQVMRCTRAQARALLHRGRDALRARRRREHPC